MRKLLKILAWIAGIGLVIVVALGFFAGHLLGSMCGNEVLAEVTSPNGKHKAVVFQRDCGATSGFSTQVSLLRASQSLGNDSGNIFIADSNHGAAPPGPGGGPTADVQWISSDELLIVHHPKSRVFLAEAKSSGVRITYRVEE